MNTTLTPNQVESFANFCRGQGYAEGREAFQAVVASLQEQLDSALEDAELLAAELRREKTLRVGLELMLRELGTQLKDTEELTR